MKRAVETRSLEAAPNDLGHELRDQISDQEHCQRACQTRHPGKENRKAVVNARPDAE
jgi:hypothetical protein